MRKQHGEPVRELGAAGKPAEVERIGPPETVLPQLRHQRNQREIRALFQDDELIFAPLVFIEQGCDHRPVLLDCDGLQEHGLCPGIATDPVHGDQGRLRKIDFARQGKPARQAARGATGTIEQPKALRFAGGPQGMIGFGRAEPGKH